MSLFSNFSRQIDRQSSVSTKKHKQRSLRMEPLEERALLAVSVAEFNAISAAYGLNLPTYADDAAMNAAYNVIEVTDLTDESLRDAIATAAGDTKPDLIVVRTTGTDNKITLSDGELGISNSGAGRVNIVGWGDESLTISGNEQSRVFYVGYNANVAIAGITIADGKVTGDGGGLFFNSDRRVAEGGGAGNSTLLLSSVIFDSNTASGYGGGMAQTRNGNSASSTLNNVLFVGNAASSGGGGMAVLQTGTTLNTATITNCTFVANSSGSAAGAGLYSGNQNNVTVKNTLLWGNTTSHANKDIYLVDSGVKTVTNSVWETGYIQTASATNQTGSAANPNLDANYKPTSLSATIIDKGAAVTGLSYDLAGNARVLPTGGAIDIGAYEYDGVIAKDNDYTFDLNADFSDTEGEIKFEFNPLDNDVSYRGADKTTLDVEVVSWSSNFYNPDSLFNALTLNADNTFTLDWLAIAGRVSGEQWFEYTVTDSVTGTSSTARVTFTMDYSGGLIVTSTETNGDWNFADLGVEEAYYVSEWLNINTITFSEDLAGETIDMPQSMPITRDMNLIGPQSENVILVAADGQRLFAINGTSENVINVTMKGLTLSGGDAGEGDGGAISASYVNLTLENVNIENNTARDGGGIALANGTGTFNNVKFDDNMASVLYVDPNPEIDGDEIYVGSGGALYVDRASITMTGGSFTANHADSDGGAFATGNISSEQEISYVFNGVEFYNNTANASGGAIWASTGNSLTIENSIFQDNGAGMTDLLTGETISQGHGGAVWTTTDTFKVSNSFFLGNMASMDGGAINIGSATAATILSSTIVENWAAEGYGGGIAFSNATTPLTLNNTIVAGNNYTGLHFGDNSTANDLYDGSGTEISVAGKNNIIGVNSRFVGLTDATNQVGTVANPLDPGLDDAFVPIYGGPAANNGDASLAAGITTDLAGNARFQGSGMDIGAYELGTYVVTTLVDVVADDGLLSLREALDLAKDSPNDITFAAGLFGDTIAMLTLTEGEILLDFDVVIIGPGADKLAISGNEESRIFNVAKNVTVSISDMTLTEGYTAERGGAIYSSGNLTLTNVNVSDSVAVSHGGGLYQNTGSVTIIGGLFEGNKAAYGAGATFVNAYATVTTVDFEGNIASNKGGALHQDRGVLVVTGGTIKNNEAKLGAGFFQYTNSTATFNGTEFTLNAATERGGATYSHSSLTLNNVNVNNCSAESHGGGVYQNTGTITINGGVFKDNQAVYGAGASFENANATITDASFDGNIASYKGGALHQDRGTLTVNGGVVENNEARIGAGFFQYTEGTATFNETEFSYNVASSYGGGIYSMATLILDDVEIDNCTAGTHGGGIYSEANLTLTDVTVTNCLAGTAETAGTYGGGVCHKDGTLSISGGIFENNEAAWGGAVWTNNALDTVSISNVDFISNKARSGAGVYNSASEMTISGGSFNSNVALNNGAFYQARNSNTTIDGTSFSENEAGNKGGAIYLFGELTLLNFEDDSFADNSAVNGGDAIAIVRPGKLTVPAIDDFFEALPDGEEIYFDDADVANWLL